MWVEVRDSKETWNRLLRTYLSPKPLIGGAAAALEFDD
jgi:hypothetical protein